MEYSFFKNSEAHKITLNDYSFIYECNGEKQVFQYAQINRVRLRRPKPVDKENLFSCIIYLTDGPNIHLQSYSTSHEVVTNQFNHYNQFIRVLHLHLKSKSEANFCYGMTYSNLILHALVASITVAVSYAVSYILRDYAFIIYSIVPAVVIFSTIKIITDKPGSYRPDIIPYHILPGTV